METDAALRCASCGGVLHTVAGEDFDMPVIHLDRDAHGELALRIADKCIVTLLVAQHFRCLVEDMKHVFIRIVACHFCLQKEIGTLCILKCT